MKYLKNIKSLEELKKAYRELTKKLHPDCGGSDAEMKILNNEYDELFEVLKNKHNATADESHKTTETPDEFKSIIDKLIRMQGVEVELCGSWIWCRGNTWTYRDDLKAAGFQWSKSKKSWYWFHREEDSDNRKKRGHYTMDKIREKFGSQLFENLDPIPEIA